LGKGKINFVVSKKQDKSLSCFLQNRPEVTQLELNFLFDKNWIEKMNKAKQILEEVFESKINKSKIPILNLH